MACNMFVVFIMMIAHKYTYYTHTHSFAEIKVYCCLDGAVQSIEGVFLETLLVKSGFVILTWTNL
jgi:hypothetical protein